MVHERSQPLDDDALAAMEARARATLRGERPPDRADATDILALAAELRRLRSDEAEGDGHSRKPLAGLRIMVVDDARDTLESLVWVLERAGAEVDSSETAPDALAAMTARPPDILLSDISMPGYDGLWLVHQVRRTAELAHVRRVALSAHAMEDDVISARMAGYQAHIAKPADAERLVAELARVAAFTPEPRPD